MLDFGNLKNTLKTRKFKGVKMRKDVMRQINNHVKKEITLNKAELARRLDCDVRTISKYLQNSTEIERKTRQLESKLHKYEELIIEKNRLI